MKVVFCNQLTEMLGVQILSACLKQAGHTTDLVFEPNLFATGAIKEPRLIEFLSNDELVVQDILAAEPDLVGFPIDINGYLWALKIAGAVKARRPELPIIFGGIHVTMCPDVVIERPEVDYIAVNEAEHALVELCDVLDGRKTGDPARSKASGPAIPTAPSTATRCGRSTRPSTTSRSSTSRCTTTSCRASRPST